MPRWTLTAAALAALHLATGGFAAADQWQFSHQTDPFTDVVTHTLAIPSERADGWLLVSCASGPRPFSAFLWSRPDRRMHGTDIQVDWRLGARPARSDFWTVGAEGAAALDPHGASPLVEDILDAETEDPGMIVRAGGNYMSFDMGGFTPAFERLISRCAAGTGGQP